MIAKKRIIIIAIIFKDTKSIKMLDKYDVF